MSSIKSLKPYSFKQAQLQAPVHNENIKKYKRKSNLAAAAVTLCGGATGFGIAKEQFDSQKQQVVNNYNDYINKLVDDAKIRRIEIDGHMSQSEIEEIRGFKYKRNIFKLNKKLAELKKQYKGKYTKNVIVGTLIGGIAGSLILIHSFLEVKKKIDKNSLNKETSSNLIKHKNSVSNKNISFGSRFWNGDYYSTEEENIAKNIVKYKLDKDFPAGLTSWNKYKYTESSYAKKPKSDMEYHDILLSQEINVPPKPPEYYRNYDKWFNTDRYKSFCTWPEYEEKLEQYKKVRRLINYLRLENIKLEAKRIERETKIQMQSAFIKSKLFHSFISTINQKNTNKKGLIPNAIMFESSDRNESVKTIKWMINRTNTNYIELDYDPMIYHEPVNFLAKIESALEKAQNHYKQTNGQRTILYINNFDYLIKKGMDTSDIKNMIQSLSEEYKTTLVFETADSSKLEPVALQDHRFGLKFVLKEDIQPKALKELEQEFFNMNIERIGNGTGYRFNYLPGKDKYVDLYLGSFGYDKYTLWLEGKELSDIDMGCTFIDSIKKHKMFRDIYKIQTKAITNTIEETQKFLNAKFEPLYKYTLDGHMIWETLISKIK